MQSHENYQIIAVGDVFLKTKSGVAHPLSTEIETFFQSFPCVLVNLETVLVKDGQPQQKAVTLRSEPSLSEYLRKAGVDVANVANNHSFDYGIHGFRSTIAALETAGIGYLGAFRHGEQQPYVLQVDGCSIGILGYTIGAIPEGDTGVAPLDEQQIQRDIASIKSRDIDRAIVNLHWGEEYVAYPSPEQQRLARRLIDCGADVIIGHHPHVIQGIELYKNGVIFYSLGNFNMMSSNNLDKQFLRRRWGLIALLNFLSPSSVVYEIIPVQIDADYRPSFVTKKEAEAFLAYLDNISEPLKPEIKRLFWLREASWVHFCNHLPSFIRRIKRYGVRHFFQMLRWMLSPSNYGFYMGLLLLMITKASHWALAKKVYTRHRG